MNCIILSRPHYWHMKVPVRSFKEVFVSKHHCIARLPVILLGVLALSACKTSGVVGNNVDKVDDKVMQQFTADVQHNLQLNILSASRGKLVGAARLHVTLNKRSEPVACKVTAAAPKHSAMLPADVVRSDFATLANVIEAQCWMTVYPKVPEPLFSEDDSVEMVAPVIVMLPAHWKNAHASWDLRQQQRQYFWHQLMRTQPVDSIGTAVIRYQANAQGKVQGCLIDLQPTRLRTDAFRLDSALQARLNSACLGLDLQAMPGFAPDPHGRVEGYALVEYAPWKVGRP